MKKHFYNLSLIVPLLFLSQMIFGQTAIPLTAGSFNHDAVGENGCSAPNPLTIATAGGMDASGYAFNGASGWPGSLNYNFGPNPYVLQPYTGANARRVLVGTSATLTLATPAHLANLHFLVTSTEGASTATYTANFTDATSQTMMTATTPDWIVGGGGVFISNATSTNDCDVKGAGKLYQVSGNILPANYGKLVQSVTVSRPGGGGSRLYIFGASSCGAGPYFTVCPGNIAVSCPGPVSYTASTAEATSVNYSFSGATSGSGSGTGSGSSFNIGVTTVTITATNSCGTNTCSFTVTVDDNTDPTISCPANISQGTDPGVCGAAVSFSVSANDNCPGVALNQTGGLASGATFPVGTTVNIFQATDASGNTATCAFSVTVSDEENPVANCPANIVVNNTPGTCAAQVYYNVTSTDNCEVTSLPGFSFLGTSGNSSYFVSNGVFTWTAALAHSQANGLHMAVVTSAAENAFIQAGLAGRDPWIGLSDATTEGVYRWITGEPFGYTNWNGGEPNNLGNEDYANMLPTGKWNDLPNAGPAFQPTEYLLELESTQIFLQSGLYSGESFPVGTTTVEYQAVDAAGNTSDCSFDVTVNDNENPTISCPADIATTTDPGVCGAAVSFSVSTSDNCPGEISTQNGGQISGSTFPVGTTVNVFEATDASGNTATCSFSVTVSDDENPTISCPANISQGTDPGVCGAAVLFSVTASDNCPGEILSQTGGQASGSTFPVGTTTNTFLVTDASGNTGECSFDVTVSDDENPTANCPADIAVGTDPGVCGAAVLFSVTASDNCAGATFAQTGGLASGSTFPVGTTTNTFLATDAAGNTGECSFDVTVYDDENPTANCPADIAVGTDPGVCGAAVSFSVTASDNCPGATLAQAGGQTSGSTFPVGTTTNTFLATDAAGNTGQCSFDVTVSDDENPVAVCQNISVTPGGSGIYTIDPNAVDNGSSDNCGTALSVNPATIPCFHTAYQQTVTLTVTDLASNTATCTATVTLLGDSDCDGVGDFCDLCPGGNDQIDNNHDGQPDCHVFPGFNNLPAAWKCGNKKVYMCHIPPGNPGNAHTICVSVNAVASHLAHGDYIGPCGNASCSQNASAPAFSLTFDAYRKGEVAKLQWVSQTGATNDYFVVERAASEFGDFMPIQKVAGSGVAGEILYFNELDKKPLPGENFYRLILVSKNGDERYSEVKKVVFPTGFMVYPNPNSGDVLNISLADFAGKTADLEIHDALGKVLFSKHFDALPTGELRHDLSKFASGTYFLSVKIEGQRAEIRRFVVQRL